VTAAVPFSSIPSASAATSASGAEKSRTEQISLNGLWSFRLDRQDVGLAENWQYPDVPETGWHPVTVPHTWQIDPETTDYMGAGWYRRSFDAPTAWADRAVRVEFEAVFHTATVWLNGAEVSRHVGKGYTAFTRDLGPRLRFAGRNTLVVRADNSFSESMLPRGRSSDWAHDGGIYRPVQLLVTPKAFVETIAVDAEPDLAANEASLHVTATVRNLHSALFDGRLTFVVFDEETGNAVPVEAPAAEVKLAPGDRSAVKFAVAKIRAPKLWHFDHPHLYRIEVTLSNGHSYETTVGMRKIETRGAAFYLNGEQVRLMGVERMAGCSPEFGMAEPWAWIDHDHADMKDLNCVYTRVHWQQDRRVLDWCDRHGILIQTEVPTWGPQTFQEKTPEPLPELMHNGLEQLREMIERDRNHPCIFSWGMCNEIDGQNPPAYAFAKRMYEEAKKLDPRRLVTYASNSLQKSPEKDVSGLMDYIMWNEYYESWYDGTPDSLARNLDEIHRAFPDKAIVISEYGYCACTADRPEGDARRGEILRDHDKVFRERDYVAGLIFFDYNDYRTHIGDRGTGVMKQRVHGVVDLYGTKKPSWEILRNESSPVESMRVSGNPAALTIELKTRSLVPSYALRGYEIRAVAYGYDKIPVERAGVRLETVVPGESRSVQLKFTQAGIACIQVDLMRPTGFSAFSTVWMP
jgi:beta-glucuronidase